METKIEVTKLTHEEIVNILATAFYGNNEMEVSYPDSMDDMASYIKTVLERDTYRDNDMGGQAGRNS